MRLCEINSPQHAWHPIHVIVPQHVGDPIKGVVPTHEKPDRDQGTQLVCEDPKGQGFQSISNDQNPNLRWQIALRGTNIYYVVITMSS